ncbi:hypothetical protein [Flagellimonas aequoris]|uniref:Uncharacterized protein n=1 Tax=Flagellimonas aequoris TaxID=2306997 RepID=A0A418N9M0_9FLAO|nr:hypothetical protein [Allomuricauda aequoris]RIV72105.1 hypothetical protein D2U88_06530 [Allomuricauda aequoris]TXK03878.1 hypothetical protein FQ019_06490 [Allomuricauda aequoris]
MEHFEKKHLVTSVDLGYFENEEKPVYHFIYGSQLYETLFGVFAKFQLETVNEGESYLLKKLTILLMNYQGTINLGFTSHKLHFDGNHNVYFAVRGGRKRFKKDLNFEKPIELKKGERFPLIFNRILYPLPGFSFDIDERNSRDNSKPLKVKIPRTRIFDTEFQYRNGVDYYDKELRPGMLGFNGISMESLKNSHPFPSPRCHQSNVSLKFQ